MFKSVKIVVIVGMVFLLGMLFVQDVQANVYPSFVRLTQDTSRAPFDGSFADGTGAAVRFMLNDAADSVLVEVVPAGGGAAVRTLHAGAMLAGDNAVMWDGADDGGVPAAAGSYKFVVTAYSQGYSSYTVYHLSTPSIYTRGITNVTNPAQRWFGFTYAVSGGGYATGLVRHASDGEQYGNTPGSALLTTTGVSLTTANRRYGPAADADGYVYVVGLDERRIYRFHTDTLNVQLFDSSAYGMRIQSVDVSGSGANKVLYVTGDNAIFRIPIGTQSFNTEAPQTLVTVGSDTGKGLVFWDAEFGSDSSLYVIWRTTGTLGSFPAGARGIAKFSLNGFTTAKTMADTAWTSLMADGDPVTLALWENGTDTGSDDILYMSHDLGGAKVERSGIYMFTNLTGTAPTRAMAWTDPDDNASSARSAVDVDVLGNVIYFENSNEQVVLLSPPTGANSYAYTSFDAYDVTASGKVFPLLTIAEARIDANNDRRPDLQGDTVRVIGIINSTNVQTSQFGYFMQDDSAGIEIFKSSLTGAPTVAPGYRVAVTGVIDYYRGTTEIVPLNLATDVVVLDTGRVVTSVPLTIGQYRANPEKYESRRITLAVAQPLNFTSAQWPAAGSDSPSSPPMNLWDGRDTVALRIDKDTEVDGSPYPTFPVRLSGIATQYTTGAADIGYQITPFFVSDFVPINAPPLSNFAMVSPANGSDLIVADAGQAFDFSWHAAVDWNNDALIYQFKPVAFAGLVANNSGHDTVKTVTGAQLLTYLGTNDSLALLWTVQAKDPTNPVVTSTDTFTVMLHKFTPTAGWSQDSSNVTVSLRSVSTVSPMVAWMCGQYGTVLRTVDGGETWTSVGGGPISTGATLNNIYAVSDQIAYTTNSPDSANIYRTTDGGTTWERVFNDPVTATAFTDAVHMFDAQHGIALGDPANGYWFIIETTDGGNTWQHLINEPAQAGTESGYTNSLAVIGTTHIWFGTNNNRIYRSTDGGASWTFAPTTSTSSFSVWFNDTQYGVAGFASGKVEISSDGGATWTPVTVTGATGTVYGITGFGKDFWLTSGSTVFHSTDRGASWTAEATSPGGTFRHISFVKSGSYVTGWTQTTTGKIMAFSGTLTGVKEQAPAEIPATFALEQNFPNPFNPSTTIRFSLPTQSYVSVKIYDVLGREVATLIDQTRDAGVVQVVWDGRSSTGAQVASGMYIYRMEARPSDGNSPFVSVKKMMLLK